MMIKGYQIALVFATSLLLSCSAIMNSVNKGKYDKSNTVEVSNYEEIDINDNFSSASISLNPTVGILGKGKMDFGAGADLKHYNAKFGNATLGFNYLVYFSSSAEWTYFTANRNIPLYELNFNYSYPIFKNITNKERYITALDQSDKDYAIITQTAVLNKFNLRLGIQSDYSRTTASGYQQVIEDNGLNSIYFVDDRDDLAEINQNNTFLNFGISYMSMMNTKLNAKGKDGKEFRAYSGIISNVYFDINYLLSTSVDRVQYAYYASLENEPSLLYEDMVSPNTYLEKQSFGFSIGYEATYATISKPKNPISSLVEIGTLPGYYNKATNSLYIKMGFKYGIGAWH